MRSFFYYGSIKKSIIQFLDVFNNIQIAKYDENGSIIKYVNVPIKFMPKAKFYVYANDRTHEKMLPMIGVEINSMEYDVERASGQKEKITISLGEDSNTYTFTPSPWNIGFTLHIAAKYINEIDQLNEQILPFFAPYVQTTINISELDIKWNMDINFQAAGVDQTAEIAEDDYRLVYWTHEYIARTYLVKPSASINIVKKIINNYYTTELSFAEIDYTSAPLSASDTWAEKILILGSKEDDEILAEYMRF